MAKTLHLVLLLACLFVVGGCSCSSDETPPGGGSCGDGTVDSGEQCDDGNVLAGDGCSAVCTNEGAGACGDGTVDTGEQCDDGNTDAGDGCSASCTNEGSGDCGNGTKDPGEGCDDGNTASGDGCSATCANEEGCGDGVIDPGELCDDGNTDDGDGCEADCTHTPTEVVVCDTLDPLPSGEVCEVTAGDSSKLIIGTVLTPGTVYEGGQVLVDGAGNISCVGCDCQASAGGATVITCPQGVVSPGLINTHDHITFTQNAPYNDTGERYEHRHDWRTGKNGHTEINTAGNASKDEISWGELRFLLGGATSTVGSGSASGLLRNLDVASDQQGLNQTPVEFDTFPLGDSNGTQIASGCGYPDIVTEGSIATEDAYLPHISEGIDAFARNEFLCASSTMDGGQDLAQKQSAFIHSIGLTAIDYALMAGDGVAIIWSPRSNVTLYGDTAIVTEAARLGALVALGTDWVATGSMNMLRELRCADELNKTYFGGFFTDEKLWLMATRSAAEATATDDVIGTLAKDKIADIAIFDGSAHKHFRAVLDAEPADVALVLRAGKPLYGDTAIIDGLGATSCDPLDVCSSAKQVCLQDEIGKSYAALETAAAGSYEAFFCGVPDNEPSCVPTRPEGKNGSTVYTGAITATDGDGDGIADADDNCVTVFNPVRPVDDGVQADFDADGEGDACDVCPLNVDTTSCSSVDPNDQDADTVPNADDNCPTTPNPDQADGDNDDKGDACDPCPTEPNPGSEACTVTIYDIKKGVVSAGSQVALGSHVVTGRYASGFFLQVKTGDPGYAGADFSGIFVYAPGNTVLVGDRVSITSATVQDFFGQLQLSNATVVVDSSLGEEPPAPVVATPAEVATGGAKAAALESVLVTVQNVSVTDIAPAPGPGDMAPTSEFVVAGVLRVNDLLYKITPFPAVGQTYTSLTGVLDFRNGNSKLELRSASDVLGGSAVLIQLSPAQSFAKLGQTGVPTYPEALSVQLSSAVASDTFVPVTSSDPTSLVVVGGGVTVPAGQSSAPILVDGLLQATSVTLSATLGVTLAASVRVVAPTEQPALASLAPPAATLPEMGTTSFTVSLDIPAPAGGTVVGLAVTPAGAGTVPATVMVAQDQIQASFDYSDSGTTTSSTVTATLGAQSLMSTVTVGSAIGGLVINEVEYDQIGPDTGEFVEIYNGSGAPVDLTNITLVLINGSNMTAVVYKTIDLSGAGTLAPGQYLVVASSTVTPAAGALTVLFAAAADNVQNGAPDGAALVDNATGTVIDALSYEGAVALATIPNVSGMVNLVEGTVLPTATADSNTAVGSLSRVPNGTDTDNAATDWAFSTTPTPGAANVP